jgi:hypothetical protein
MRGGSSLRGAGAGGGGQRRHYEKRNPQAHQFVNASFLQVVTSLIRNVSRPNEGMWRQSMVRMGFRSQVGRGFAVHSEAAQSRHETAD